MGQRTYGDTGRLEDGVFVTEYSSIPQLASWVLRQDGRAVPLEPDELRRDVAGALRRVRDRHEGKPPTPGARDAAALRADGAVERRPARSRPSASPSCRRCSRSCSPRAARDATPRSRPQLLERFPSIPDEELEEHLSLLNLVNFGGGCYTIYAELRDDVVHVDKELWGDTFRLPPRLTPLEARAIRLALEYVGPMVAAEAHTPLARVRKKLEETFGVFELAQTPEPHIEVEEEDIISTLARGIREHRLVEIEYQKETDTAPSLRVVEPYKLERRLPNWSVHTWDQTSDGERSFRVDRMRSAKLTKQKFTPRPEFEPSGFSDAFTARVWYSPEIARFEIERGARPLADGSAVRDRSVGSYEWLESDILSKRGEAVVLEPGELRSRISDRARELAKELGVERMRVKV